MKQVMVHFDYPNFSEQQYNAAWEKLRAAGHSNPKGLVLHLAGSRPGGGMMITDIWESEQAFKDFGQVLMPILTQLDVPQMQPVISPAVNIYEEKAVGTRF